ncbi:hypothetical protein O3P69_000695 [Scylla paramamosain]|uniref:Uncharacterized protein n=1 Tax=Scylla paramamosain TaxID=85552 RepID=A0AAW0URS2_SCYPA
MMYPERRANLVQICLLRHHGRQSVPSFHNIHCHYSTTCLFSLGAQNEENHSFYMVDMNTLRGAENLG